MIKDINKIPDIEFEDSGMLGWRYFKKDFIKFKQEHALYGDIVLEKRLGGSIDIYSSAFKSENFLKEIRKIWEERYHYVASTFEDLIVVCEIADEENIPFAYLLPEANSHKANEITGKDEVFAISKSLYNYIIKEAKKKNNKLVILKATDVYEITVQEKSETDSFYKINIEKVDVIKIN